MFKYKHNLNIFNKFYSFFKLIKIFISLFSNHLSIESSTYYSSTFSAVVEVDKGATVGLTGGLAHF